MKSRIRIRPRFWLSLPKVDRRWGWVPLSLIFRKQRLLERPTSGVPSSAVSLFKAFSFVSQISHFHAYENKQILRHTVRHQHFSLMRTPVEHPASAKEPRRPETAVPSALLRERSIETQLRSWILHEQRNTSTIARYLQEITKQGADANGPRAWPAESRIALPAQRLLIPPRPLRPRISNSVFPKPESHREVLRTISKKTWDVVVEEQLAPRLRKVEPRSPAALGVPFAVQSVEQVWRQPQHPARESNNTRPSPSASQTTIAKSPVHTSLDPASVAPAPVPVFAPTKLEGPAMERLAEDVMKRIERHLRIERERRGI